ncbi:YdcF family protein [Polymorphobacter fuscus]|uniref:YdcF family protein n=2 Tax=Sandarakinorhabdus fusca TaxID=1439888 RepID=A0A7C9LHC3_9SPHN|nr:YdcF family protein [Polymorphobacter fuscus]MQT18167.1 YdcF family protein [Polymorphobacter fuscus]
MLAAVLAGPVPVLAQDPPGYARPFADTLETRVFPLFAMLHAAPGWTAALRADPQLARLASARAARIPPDACAPAPQCLADAWLWTTDDIAKVSERLRLIMRDRALADALVVRQMRPSGRFARHAALADADLLGAAWADAANGINRVIAIYAKGEPPRYPKIDAMIFDVARPEYPQLLAAHGTSIAALPPPDDTVFDPVQRYATGLLMINERADAGAFRPLLGGDNAATVRAIAGTDWRGERHSALLVFGHGPEDAQSRTGVMGHIRMRIAADLFARRLAPFIIVSGGNVHPNRTPFNEAVEMKRLLIEQHGVPADRILIEPHARHTTTNLRNTARLLLAAGFPADRPALVVSDHATIRYIGSAELSVRNLREMGLQPGTLAPGPDRFSLMFKPDPAAFHVEVADPLDP